MKNTFLFLSFALVFLSSCSYEKGWKLVWSEEFNSGQLDETVWSRVPRGTANWDDTQDPVDSRLLEWRDGTIVLKGIVNDNPADTAKYLTTGIYSKNKHVFSAAGKKAQRIVVRARLQRATGAWPAIWMMPYEGGVQWPYGGEIDIMERLNHDTIAYQTVHTAYTHYRHPELKHGGIGAIDPDGYNEYGVDIHPDSIVFHINGHHTFTYKHDTTLPEVASGNLPAEMDQFPFWHDWYLLIDQQLGGNWVGPVDPKDLPVEMEVDWVRHYRK